MKLVQAINESGISVAEFYTDGKTIVVGSDDENGGYDISYKVGDMPPYASEHADTLEQAEASIDSSGLPYTLGDDGWDPQEGE